MNKKTIKFLTLMITIGLMVTNLSSSTVSASNNNSELVSARITQNNIQTYKSNNENPESIKLALDFSIYTLNGEGSKIEIPLEGVHPLTSSSLSSFDMTEPLLLFNRVEVDSEGLVIGSSVVSHIVNGVNVSKIVLELAPFSKVGTSSITLSFKVNPIYFGKIPPNTVLWDKPIVNFYDNNSNLVNYKFANDNANFKLYSVKLSTFTSGMRKLTPGSTDLEEYTNITTTTFSLNFNYRISNSDLFIPDNTYTPSFTISIPEWVRISQSSLAMNEMRNYTLSVENGKRIYSVPITQNHPILNQNLGAFWGFDLKFEFEENQRIVGRTFSVENNFLFKLTNGPITDVRTLESVNRHNANLRISDIAMWDFKNTGYHYYYPNNTYIPVVDMSATNSETREYSHSGEIYGTSINHLGNNGLVNVTGVVHRIYQENTPGPKVNFGSLILVVQKNSTHVQMFKVDLEITNAITNSTRIFSTNQIDNFIYEGPASGVSRKDLHINIQGLNLSENEFISSVNAIPFGSKGNLQEGVLLPGVKLILKYKAKMWNSDYWPDGSLIDKTVTHAVDIKSSTVYDPGQGGHPSNYPYGETLTHYYAPSNMLGMDIDLVANNNLNLSTPTINSDEDRKFTISGKVINDYTNGKWLNPTIIIKVPSVIEITSNTTSTTIRQSTGYVSDTITFSISKLNTIGEHTYYQLSALGSFKMNTNPFTVSPQVGVTNDIDNISISFRVKPGVVNGTYRFPEMWYGGEGMNAIFRSETSRPEINYYSTGANHFSEGMKNEIGLIGDVRGYRFVKTVPNLGTNYFTIAQSTSVSTSVSSKSDANDQNEPFVTVDKFAINKNSVVAVKLTVRNDGNTTLHNLKLHNIINYVDSHQINLNPLAEMQLQSVISNSGTIYYSNQAVIENGRYTSENLSNWATNDLSNKGFTTTIPTQENMKLVKQLYIQLASLSPNSTYEVILNFRVSDVDNITAYNQFVYSYRAPNSNSTASKFISSPVEFSTQVNQINYSPGTSDAVMNMPVSHSAVRPISGNSAITVSSGVPSRIGYEFKGWKYQNQSELYGASGNLLRDFVFGQNSDNTVQLVAQWDKKSIVVEFYKNYGSDTDKVTLNVLYDTNYTIPPSTTFSRVGYQFLGWTEDTYGFESKLSGTTKLANYNSTTKKYYAQWKPNTHTVIVKNFYGDLTTTVMSKEYDTTISSAELSRIRDGYTFSHWLIEETNQTFVPGITKVTGDITLVGQWVGKEMTLRFRSGEGIGIKNDISFRFGSTVLIPNAHPEMSLTGHTFSGWNRNPDGTGVIVSQGVKSFEDYEEVVTLYAQWEPIELTITLFSHPSQTHVGTVEYLYGNTITLPNQALIETRLGYTFDKWYLNSSLVGTSFAHGVNHAFLSITDFPLYARWTPNTYEVTFNANGGSGTMSNQTFTYDEAKVLTSNTFAKNGYTFVGWNTAADGSAIAYTNGQAIENIATSGTVALYAQWEADTYEVVFDANGGSGTMSNQSFAYDEAKALTSNTFAKNGYTFVGWNTAIDGTAIAYTNGQTIESIATSGTVTLYAQWSENYYLVNIFDNDDVIIDSLQLTYNQVVSLNDYQIALRGYHVSGWYYDSQRTTVAPTEISLTNNIALYISISPNVYTVYFNANEGTGHMLPIEIEYDENYVLPTNQFVRRGYTFAGWVMNSNTTRLMRTLLTRNNSLISDESIVFNLASEGRVELNAQWIPNRYTLVYLPGNGFAPEIQNQVFDQDFTIKSAPSREGYKFVSWNTTIDGSGTNYSSGSIATNLVDLGSISLHAIWENVDTINPSLPNTGIASSYLAYLLMTLGGFAIYLGLKKE